MVRRFKKWLAALIAIAFLIYFLFGWYAAYSLTHQRFPEIDVNPEMISQTYEDITFTTADGIKISGWFFLQGERVIILAHGLTQNRYDRNYYFVPLIRDLLAENYSVLTFDLRSHGLSGGSATTYGLNEGNDIISAVDYLVSKGYEEEKMAIVANSTGAISTLMVGNKLNRVGAMVIDSVPTEFKPVIARRLWQEKHVPPFFNPYIFFLVENVYDLDLDSVKPIEKVRDIKNRPILFFHAALDTTFLLEDGRKVFEAAGEGSKFVVFPKGEHIATYRSDPMLWKQEVFSFLNSQLE